MTAHSACSVTEDFTSDSDLDENELDHLVTAQVPQSTQNSTRWAVKAFEGKLKFIYLFYRGAYMSAHVLLNLLNKLRKKR